jgi:hypothetical protein
MSLVSEKGLKRVLSSATTIQRRNHASKRTDSIGKLKSGKNDDDAENWDGHGNALVLTFLSLFVFWHLVTGGRKVPSRALSKEACGPLQQVDAVTRATWYLLNKHFSLQRPQGQLSSHFSHHVRLDGIPIEMTASEPLTLTEEYEMQESWHLDEESKVFRRVLFD